MADAAPPPPGLPVAAGRDRDKDDRRRWAARCGVAVLGIMGTLLVYGVLQVGAAASLSPLPIFPLRLLHTPAPENFPQREGPKRVGRGGISGC